MWRMLPIAGLVIAVGVVSDAQEPRKNINDASLAALRTWVHAVHAHTPGRPDASVITVAGFSYETRVDLNTAVDLFLRALMGWRYGSDDNKAAQAIVAMGHADGKDFLKRAAVLHADVAAYGDHFPRTPSVTKKVPPRTDELHLGRVLTSPTRMQPDDETPPLLREDRLLLAQDGQIVNETIGSWNWPFARSLLDLLGAGPVKRLFADRPERATDPFVSAWYHATTGYMFATGLYGDATSHLHHASMVLPDDPLALLDAACYAEVLGLPMHQALVPERNAAARRSSGGPPNWTTPDSSPALRIPSAEQTNAEAERLYRRALAVDPSLIEARVRLARLLDVRGRHEEAASEAKAALGGNPAAVTAFYAHLFGGRAAEGMAKRSEAAEHYRAALELFPDAQSALLASSHLALLESDVTGTLAPVERLGTRSMNFDADPWWQYHLCSGRDADDLLKSLWASVPRADVK
jgi:tetratricopeptide (TPR) repeat protein